MDDDAQMTKVAKNRRSTAVGTHDIHYLKHCVPLGGRPVASKPGRPLLQNPKFSCDQITIHTLPPKMFPFSLDLLHYSVREEHWSCAADGSFCNFHISGHIKCGTGMKIQDIETRHSDRTYGISELWSLEFGIRNSEKQCKSAMLS